MHSGAERNLNDVLSKYLLMGESVFSDDSDIQNLYTMTPLEVQKIKAFLLTLDDYSLLSNYNYSEP
jgi:hypothetical protein